MSTHSHETSAPLSTESLVSDHVRWGSPPFSTFLIGLLRAQLRLITFSHRGNITFSDLGLVHLGKKGLYHLENHHQKSLRASFIISLAKVE